MTTRVQIKDISDFDADRAEEPLILALKLALVEHLDEKFRGAADIAGRWTECLVYGGGTMKHTYRRTRSSRVSTSS